MQDVPEDISAAHLATLNTTEEILAAVRLAGKARFNVHAAGTTLAAHHVMQTATISMPPHKRNHRVEDVLCTGIQISPCSKYLAAWVRGELVPDTPPSGHEDSRVLSEVQIYTIPDFQVQTSVGCGTCVPDFVWARTAPLLTVAVSPL